MGEPVLKRFHSNFILFFCLIVVLGCCSPTFADGGKLFFAAMVEKNTLNTGQVVLEWGSLEGEIPPEIVSFKLYRSVNGGSHQILSEVPYQLIDPDALANFISNDLVSRTSDLIDTLNRMSEGKGGGHITESNAAKYLLSLLKPSSVDYDPFTAMLLSRAHLAASVGMGLAFVDDTVNEADSYQYLLTAVTASGESLPIGQTDTVTPAVMTIIPAPTGLDQVRLDRCSALGGGRDDNQINFIWDVPSSPQDLGLKAVTYGYELFWSATDLGAVDFRAGIPEELHRVNREPVVVAGAPPATGADSYLARDGAANHTVGPAWKRGQSYFYYVVARDITGHYCQPVSPVELTVTDAMPPRSVWNAHSQEIKDPADNNTPRLALVWDAPTALNFTRYYGANRTICSATPDEVCWVGTGKSCTNDTPRCADLAVDHYRVFRFESPQQAAAWGMDTDGDGWPDTFENDPLVQTDSCSVEDHPAGNAVSWHTDEVPDEWIAKIPPFDSSFTRNPTETHRQVFYIDYDITDNNKVYWYRVLAVDGQGNQSPLSAPLRGVLYDRSQPKTSAYMAGRSCRYSFDKLADCEIPPEDDDVFVLQDKTGDAVSYKFFQQCSLEQGRTTLQVLDSGLLDKGVARIKSGKLPGNQKCTIIPCAGSQGFMIRFYDAAGDILASTDSFTLENICVFNGCVILQKECSWKQIDDPYSVQNDPVQVCVDLQANQSARVYYQTPTGMSAFYTFNAVSTSQQVCHEFYDLEGLAPADMCLGVRVFSENHVGSGMAYLGCMELHPKDDQPPPTPLLEPVEAAQHDGDVFFDLHWSMLSAGVGSYILRVTNDVGQDYESLWNILPDASGRYLYSHKLEEADMGKELCYQIRALSTDMRASDWSIEQCGTWEPGEPENLGWPPVAEPVNGGDIGAFYMQTSDDRQPVLVLSDNLTSEVDRLMACAEQVPVCDQKTNGNPCLRNDEIQYINCPACTILRARILAENFIVYRQEQGHDFVQVSPLVEGVHCRTEDKGEIVDFLQDPFVTLIDVLTTTVTGVDDPAAIGGGVRVLFKDRYPFRAGSTIRYKLVSIHPETGEPEKVFTSNWVELQ